MVAEVNPQETSRAQAFELWMKAPNPMVTFFKTINVTRLVLIIRKKRLKFNMLLDYCIGRAAASIKEFYLLPVGNRLMQYDTLAVNTIVRNMDGEVSSCDIPYMDDLNEFNRQYLKYTSQVAESGQDHDLSDDCMVIGTSAIIETEIDGAVGKKAVETKHFHPASLAHKVADMGRQRIVYEGTQMDGAHAGRFLANLQDEINHLK